MGARTVRCTWSAVVAATALQVPSSAYCLPLTAYCLLLTAYFLLPHAKGPYIMLTGSMSIMTERGGTLFCSQWSASCRRIKFSRAREVHLIRN